MTISHKNKTLATLLASLLGGTGTHRFYLHGNKDVWAWLHLSTLPLSAIATLLWPTQPIMFVAAPLFISILSGFLEALVIGLIPDEKWDARHNPNSGQQSQSDWPLAVLLVLTVGAGAVALIAALARFLDLLYTGGSFG